MRTSEDLAELAQNEDYVPAKRKPSTMSTTSSEHIAQSRDTLMPTVSGLSRIVYLHKSDNLRTHH